MDETETIEAAIRLIRERHPKRDIVVLYEDQPTNDFIPLFTKYTGYVVPMA